MKTILLSLLVTSLGLMAQTTPVPPASPAATNPASAKITLLAPPGVAPKTVTKTPRVSTNPPAPAFPTATIPGPAAATRVTTPPGGASAAPALPAAPNANAAPLAPAATEPATITPSVPTPPLSAKASDEQTIPPRYINWLSVDLNQVLQIYADLVGRSILRSAGLASPPIVFVNQTELTKREAIQAIDAVLALNSIAMINVGEKFVKAVPIAQANTEGAAFNQLTAEQLPDMGQYVTHVVQLKYTKPSEIMPVLQPFAKIPNSVLPIESSQMLVLRDYTENIKRMLEMIEKVDVSIQSEFVSEVIPIKFAKVEDISAALNSLSGGGGGTTVGARSSTGTPGTPTGARGLPGQPGYNPSQPITPGALGAPTAGTPSSGASFSDRIRSIINRASSPTGSGDLQILGVTKIVADARSNSLLIFATRQDMAMIKDIVAKLDVVLAQVLIETIIFDVTVGDTWALGVSAAQREKNLTPDLTTAGGYNNANQFFNWLNNVTSNSTTRAAGTPKPTPTLPPGFSYFGKFNESLDFVIQAAAGDNRVKVVQKPRIQTSHATPASLFIGSTVPYVSSTYYGGGYAGGPSSSYQQLQVGIGLNVTPFINSDGLVVMKIDEQISEIDGSTAITGVGDVPNTKTSSLSAEIAVRDGESVILGGIIRNSDEKKNSGVPFLKDIPLLGALFRTSSSANKRQETVVLMRPTVLRTPELAALQVKKEERHMPNLMKAEAEFNIDEQKRYEQSKKELFKKGIPVTTEEQTMSQKEPGNPTTPLPPGEPKMSQQELFNRTTPFTPEEEKLYGNPAPVPAQP